MELTKPAFMRHDISDELWAKIELRQRKIMEKGGIGRKRAEMD